MKKVLLGLFVIFCFVGTALAEDDMVELFNGKNFDGWKVGENADSFTIEDGVMKINGKVGHLFYVGPVHNHCWKNFHLQAVVMTKEHANSGIYIHTKYQESGFPTTGHECQIANTHQDPQKTAGIYNRCKVNPAPCNDDEWFTYDIIVEGRHIITKINGKVCADWTETDDDIDANDPGRKFSEGTFALQAHDPGSVVYIKSFKVKALDD